MSNSAPGHSGELLQPGEEQEPRKEEPSKQDRMGSSAQSGRFLKTVVIEQNKNFVQLRGGQI